MATRAATKTGPVAPKPKTLYTHERHPYTPVHPTEAHQADHAARKAQAQHSWRARIALMNEWVAVHLTEIVSTMWCAYFFALLAGSGFPGLSASPTQLVQWFSQTFLQLVFLPIIAVGTAVLGRGAEKLALSMYHGVMRMLHDILQVMKHLDAQDRVIVMLQERMATLEEVNQRQLALLLAMQLDHTDLGQDTL